MYIIEYVDYIPNDESFSLDDYYFVEKEKAITYLENNGFRLEQYNTYKKGEPFGVLANIIQLVKFD